MLKFSHSETQNSESDTNQMKERINMQRQELFMVQDDTVEHYAKEHPEKLKEAEEKYGKLPDSIIQEIKQEFGIS